MRIRQIALVAREIEPAAEALCDCLGVEVAFRDPGVATFGLENVLMPIGETFLEIVSPTREGTSAGRQLDRRRGDGGYMVIFQTRDLGRARERMQELGVRIVWEAELDDIATIHLHPRDVGGAIVSLDAAIPYASWRWAGPGWRDHNPTHRVRALRGAEIQSADPEAMARRWGAIVEAEPAPCADDAYEIPLEEHGTLRFVPLGDDRGEGLTALTIAANDVDAIIGAARARGLATSSSSFEAAGVRIDLVD